MKILIIGKEKGIGLLGVVCFVIIIKERLVFF